MWGRGPTSIHMKAFTLNPPLTKWSIILQFVPRVKTIALLVNLFRFARGSQYVPTYDRGNQHAAPMPLLRRPSGSENNRLRLLRSRESTHAVCPRESRSALAGINTPPMTLLCLRESRSMHAGINTSPMTLLRWLNGFESFHDRGNQCVAIA